MRILGRLLSLFKSTDIIGHTDRITNKDKMMLSMATPEQLVELLLPNPEFDLSYRGDLALEAQRLFMELPRERRLQLLLVGLQHNENETRHACAAQLFWYATPLVTDALLNRLTDSDLGVKFYASSHLANVARFQPGQISRVLQAIEGALSSETDPLVQKNLEAAERRLKEAR